MQIIATSGTGLIGRALALQLTLSEMSTLVLDGQRAVPVAPTKTGFQFKFSDADAALRDLLC